MKSILPVSSFRDVRRRYKRFIYDSLPGIENEDSEKKSFLDVGSTSTSNNNNTAAGDKHHSVKTRLQTSFKIYIESFAISFGRGEPEKDTNDDSAELFSKEWITERHQTLYKNLSEIDKSVTSTLTDEDNSGVIASKVLQTRENLKQNVSTILDEKHHIEKVSSKLQKSVSGLKSSRNSLSGETLVDNIDAITSLSQRDFKSAKVGIEAWLADKLLVGRETLTAFVAGYREGKTIGLETESSMEGALKDIVAIDEEKEKKKE